MLKCFIYASINSSDAHPPPRETAGYFSHVVSPGSGALANFIEARGLGISIPRRDPRAFDRRVFERWMKEERGLCQRLACPSGTRKNLSMFLKVCFLNIRYFIACKHMNISTKVNYILFITVKTITDVNTA